MPSDVTAARAGPYRLRVRDDRFVPYFDAYRAGRTHPVLLRRWSRKGNVREAFRDVWDGVPLVLKRVVLPLTPETLVWRATRGVYAFNLVDRLAALHGRDDRPACDVHLAADRWAGRRVGWESFWVMEWLDGVSLDRLPDVTPALRRGVREAIAALHAVGLVHGDPGWANFFRTPDGRVRAIDVGGKPATAFRRAMDRVLYEHHFQEDFPPHDAMYRAARGLHERRLRRDRRKMKDLHAERHATFGPAHGDDPSVPSGDAAKGTASHDS